MNGHHADSAMVDAARRPMRFRRSRAIQSLARGLLRRGIKPNHVSIASVVFAALSAAAMVAALRIEDDWLRAVLLALSAGLILARSICNLVDGLMAVEGGLRSPTGEIYNDLPDRLSDALMLAGAGIAIGSPEGLILGFTAALLAVLTAYVRALGAAAGAGHDFGGPMAKPMRMLVIALAALLTIAEPALGWRQGIVLLVALGIVGAGCLITIVLRLHRIAATLNQRS